MEIFIQSGHIVYLSHLDHRILPGWWATFESVSAKALMFAESAQEE